MAADNDDNVTSTRVYEYLVTGRAFFVSMHNLLGEYRTMIRCFASVFDCRNRQSLACYHTLTLDIIGLHAMVLLYRNNYYSQTAPTATAACAAY